MSLCVKLNPALEKGAAFQNRKICGIKSDSQEMAA